MTASRYNQVTGICLCAVIVSALVYDGFPNLHAVALIVAIVFGGSASIVFLSRVLQASPEVVAPEAPQESTVAQNLLSEARHARAEGQLIFPFAHEIIPSETPESFDARDFVRKYIDMHDVAYSYSMYSYVHVRERHYPFVQDIVEIVERLSASAFPTFDFVLTSDGDFVIRRAGRTGQDTDPEESSGPAAEPEALLN